MFHLFFRLAALGDEMAANELHREADAGCERGNRHIGLDDARRPDRA
ncbi:hypothetical protein C7S15_8818 (plasmid) [Burkholderia cepacia]|nr:hypothetical protein [Burkholderia cepacia]MDW9232999.1 hypothetical protein [Burkholderia cepacia]